MLRIRPKARIHILIVVVALTAVDSVFILVSYGEGPSSWSTRGWAQRTTIGSHSYNDGVGGTIHYTVPANYDRTSLFRLPVSWCSLTGTPTSPSLTERNTNAVLLDRLARASIILRDQSGISLMSGLQIPGYNIHNNFPKIIDFSVRPSVAGMGDILDPEFDRAFRPASTTQGVYGGEYAGTFHRCDAAWGRDIRVGLNFINIGRFHDTRGMYEYVLPGETRTSETLGMADCEFYANDVCLAGRFAVVDRSLMPDRHEVVVAHETGHALSLPHRQSANGLSLMAFAGHTGRDGQFDNKILNTDEARLMRITSNNVIGAVKDPPNKIIYTDTLGTAAIAHLKDNSSDYLDLSKVTVILNKTGTDLFIGNQIFGLFPNETRGKTATFWTILDVDNTTKTGGSKELNRITGFPAAKAAGVELVIKTSVTGLRNIENTVYIFKEGHFSELADQETNTYIHRSVATPILRWITNTTANTSPSNTSGAPIQDTVITVLDKRLANLIIDVPFNIQTLITTYDENGNISVIDRLYNDTHERGPGLILTNPKYPECLMFPTDIPLGGTVKLNVNGVPINSIVTGILDSKEVFRELTDDKGSVSVQFRIPQDSNAGFKELLALVDGTAISVSCGLNIQRVPNLVDSNETVSVDEELEVNELEGPSINEEKSASQPRDNIGDKTNSQMPDAEIEKEEETVIDKDKQPETKGDDDAASHPTEEAKCLPNEMNDPATGECIPG